MRGYFIDNYILNPKWHTKKVDTSGLYNDLKEIIATQLHFFEELQNPSSLAQAKENLSFAKSIIARASLYIETVHAFMNLHIDVLFHIFRFLSNKDLNNCYITCTKFRDTIIKYRTLLYRYSKAFSDILDYKSLAFRRLFDCANVAFLEQMRFILAPDHKILRRWISEVKLINLEFEFAEFRRYRIGAESIMELLNIHVSKRIEFKDFAVILVGKIDHAETLGIRTISNPKLKDLSDPFLICAEFYPKRFTYCVHVDLRVYFKK